MKMSDDASHMCTTGTCILSDNDRATERSVPRLCLLQLVSCAVRYRSVTNIWSGARYTRARLLSVPGVARGSALLVGLPFRDRARAPAARGRRGRAARGAGRAATS